MSAGKTSDTAGETAMVDPVSPTRAVRGPHAERTAAMRRRLIEAAIDCLGRLGYGATTLQVVTDAAGVSRGAVLHHFPTKVDLMIAVAEFCAGKQDRLVRRLLAQTQPGMERYMAITTATWDAMVKPPSIALLEIMMGSRSDPDLGERFPAVIEALEASQRESVWREAQGVGITDRDTIEAMVQLHTAAMRGLTLELMFSRDAAKVDAAMVLLSRYKSFLTGELAKRPVA